MSSLKSVVWLMLLFGVFSAFSLTDYLYPTETNVTASYTNFTLDTDQYSIVAIENVDTFLLKNGEPVSEQSEIESALYQYYVQTYYPTSEELQSLTDAIQAFNNSRNNGYDFKNKEEYICRDDVLLSNGKITVSGKAVRCSDNESCAKNALLLFSVYGQGLNLGSAQAILTPLLEFTPVSLRMDELLGNYTEMLEDMDESTMSDTLSYIKDTSGELKADSLKIESTIFRTPRLNDSADRAACQLKCWAICPSFDLDQKAAQDIRDISSDLSDTVAPIGDYKALSSSLYTQSSQRLAHLKTEDLALYYRDTFVPLNQSGSAVIAYTQETLKHVQNKSLQNKLDDLRSLHSTIPEDISARNFTNIDRDIADYANLTAVVENDSAYLMSIYNATLDAKNIENSLILVLQSKDLDPIAMKSFELLNNKSSDIDTRFHDGLTIADLESLKGNYSELTTEAQSLLKTESQTPATRVLLLFRGFARRVNTGIALVAEKTQILPKAEIPTSTAALGGFSLLTFLSFSAILLLFFLFIFSSMRFTIPKTAHILIAAFITLLVLIFLFSFMMYIFLGRTSTDATLPEFLSDLSTRNLTTIVVDLANTSLSDADAMKACAGHLADSFEAQNKSWTIYTLTPNTCTQATSGGGNATLSLSDCSAKIGNADSTFLLGYSSRNEPPKFSIIYQNRAEIRANLNYYQSCPVVALFG